MPQGYQRGPKSANIPPKSPASECTDPVKFGKEGPVVVPLSTTFSEGGYFMKRIMKFAAFAFLVSSYPALAEEGNGTGSVRLNAPRVETPPPVIKPKLIRPPSVAGNVGAAKMRRNRSREPTSLLSRV